MNHSMIALRTNRFGNGGHNDKNGKNSKSSIENEENRSSIYSEYKKFIFVCTGLTSDVTILYVQCGMRLVEPANDIFDPFVTKLI